MTRTYTRQFYKALATLVALRGTGDDGLARLLGKEVAQRKDMDGDDQNNL
jgi:hypothetical protein